MTSLLLFGFVGTQLALALVQPVWLIYFSLLTGAVPLTFGQGGGLLSAFGRLDLSAIRLLGLLGASSLVVFLHVGQLARYLHVYRLHLLFLLFCGAAIFWSPSLEYGIRMWAKLAAPCLFLLLILAMVSSTQQLKLMEQSVLASGALILAVAIICEVMGWTRYPRGLTLPSTSPALFSAYLVAISMLALSNVKHGNWTTHLVILLCLIGGVLAAFTRITIAAMFLGFSAMIFLSSRGTSKVLLPVIGVAGFFLLFFFNETFKNRMFFDADNVSLMALASDPSTVLERVNGSGRFDAWEIVLERFFSPNPLVGSGLGATQHFYYSQSVTGLGVIHSEYVRLLAEVGVAGLALFVVAMIAYLVRSVQAYQRSPSLECRRYSLAAIGGLVAYLIFMATDNAFDYVNAFGVYVFAMIGMSEKARELEKVRVETAAIAKHAPGAAGWTASGVAPYRNRKYPIISYER